MFNIKIRRTIVSVLTLTMVLFTSCDSNAFVKNKSDIDTIKNQGVLPNDIFKDKSLNYFIKNQVNDGKPITVKVWINEDWSDSYNYLFQEYRKYRPNVTFDIISLPWKSYWVKLRLAMQSNTGPDIFHMHNSNTSDFLQYLEPLQSDIFSIERLKQDFSQQESALVDDKFYYLNVGNSTGGIFYNKAMWKAAGLSQKDIPNTWEKLRIVAKKLTKYDEKNNIVVDGFNFNKNIKSILMAMQFQKGIPPFSKDGKFNLFNNTENFENINYLRDLNMVDKVCRISDAPANVMFGEEKAAMIYSWSWVANDLERNYANVDYGFFHSPSWTEKQPPAYDFNNFECSFSINKSSDLAHKQVAQDLLLFYLSNDSVLMNVSSQAKVVPSKISLIENVYKEDDMITKQAGYIERTVFFGVLPDAVFSFLESTLEVDIMDTQVGTKDILKNTDFEIDKILSSYKFSYKLPTYKYYNEFKLQK